MAKFKLNPCKACWDKYKNSDCNINTINSCVAETAAAFSGIPSNNFIAGTDADTNWETCMEKMKAAQGRSNCDFQLSMAPVFVQAPHYFPGLLSEIGDAKVAKQTCLQKCQELRMNKQSCMENCKTDSDAVESYEVPIAPHSHIQSSNRDTKFNHWYLWILVIMVVLVLLVFIAFK